MIKTAKKTTSFKRIIAKIEGKTSGPNIIFFAGIHGNEGAGVQALRETLLKIDHENVRGIIYGIAGNLKALSLKLRYIDSDLNRLWTIDNLNKINKREILNAEEEELIELSNILKEILENNQEPFYFIDLHTTSSKTLPFITINDAMINRKFSKQFPVPIVLGIEEYLNGPVLSYINQLGYVSLGFESGQHDDPEAISNAKAFIYLTLVFSGCIEKHNIENLNIYYRLLQSASRKISDIFEVIYLHKIEDGDSFKMLNGFDSFQKIKKGTKIAISNNNVIKSKFNAKIFMPLYQKIGQEGFFIIKKIHPFILKLSSVLRKFKIDSTLVLLPGISWENKQKHVLSVNLKTARFLAKEFFHLFGYRSQQIDKRHIKLYSRERVAKAEMYKNEMWY
ncbi:MAG: succinylglutamate desuccinylase/aspartoacylase family protein [Flavobacteriaceae bacterium]